jgi:5-(carboxyamino)imidazole ribonucleotide synthase
VRIGVVGGGQLGRMLALAGVPLGLDFLAVDPSPGAPAAAVAEHVVAAYDDAAALDRLARECEVVTYEFENVPVSAARVIAASVPVLPPPEALEAAQDRLAEKRLFERLGVPVQRYEPVDSAEALAAAVESVGLPAVVKGRRMGYDGKGQRVVRSPDDVGDAWAAVGERPAIVESFVAFDRELSVLSVRDRGGETRFYPVVENHHRDGILRRSIAPASLSVELRAAAEGHAARVMEALGYVGVMAIELFEASGRLLANEIAPRVHNSGHWTIEGAETSQFENHLRAISGLPLGSTAAVGHSAMLNLLGAVPEPRAILSVPGTHLHLYGKEPRPGRKLGHVTVRADDPDELRERLAALRGAIG